MRYLYILLLLLAVLTGINTFVIAQEAPEQKISPLISINIPEPFSVPKQAFEQAIEILKKDSYNYNLNDEIIYYSALKGVLRQLSPAYNKDLLKLWGPQTDKRIQANLKGRIGSIGIRFIQDSQKGISVISDVMPGTPAEQKELKLRDEIYAINGNLLKGMSPNEVSAMIEQPIGTNIQLAVKRGKETFDVSLVSELIKVADVTTEIIDNIGIMRIRYFSQEVGEDVKRALQEFEKQKVQGIIIDVRNNSGGLLVAGSAVVEQFLPKESTIFYAVDHTGKVIRYISEAEGNTTIPVAVIINKNSASASELLAAALHDNNRAKLVGMISKGKGTTERVTRLENGYTMTFTTEAFYRANGEPWQTIGIKPDIAVEQPEADLQLSYLEKDISKRLKLDKQLAAAMKLF